jgi:tRNA G18 (ribose-2'-O)-methylase SpoU
MTGMPPRHEIRKAALGAEETVAWEYFRQTHEALEKLISEGYFILALENTPASVDYRRATYRFPLALVIGHEYNGIAPEILARCDAAISLPMRGMKISLNVAVAFGIAAYEIVHRTETNF